MDQAAANVADEAKKPEHNQDDNYSPEHGVVLSIELNFRSPIYPAVHLLAKLFQALNHGCKVTGKQGLQLAIGNVVIDGRGKAHEFFFETDPRPYRLCKPSGKGGPDLKKG
jgi:hypothetical protein